MQSPTCSKKELQVSDRIVERVISSGKQWWRISEGLLRLALWRRLWAGIGEYLEAVISRKDSRLALQESRGQTLAEPSRESRPRETAETSQALRAHRRYRDMTDQADHPTAGRRKRHKSPAMKVAILAGR